MSARQLVRTEPRLVRRVGLVVGLVLAIGLQLIEPPADLGRDGWVVASLAILMASWWATEAIPIPATALLPLVVLPATGVMSTGAAGAPYMNQINILLMGGFIVALGLERWNLHARIALNVVARAGGRPRALILGFMIAAALLSMWISNTATTLMMIPIALSVAFAEVGEEGMDGPFATALLLGVAYASSIGGVATPVGTPTNLIAMGFVEQSSGMSISFPQWMALGVPAAALLVPAAWLILTRVTFKVERHGAHAAAEEVRAKLRALGPLTTPEFRIALVFACVAGLWILRSPLTDLHIAGIEQRLAAAAAAGDAAREAALTAALAHWNGMNGSSGDAAIAIAGALALFLLPAGGLKGRGHTLMNWETAIKLPWGMLLLFGGGLSLAAAIQRTGLAEWLGAQMGGLTVLPVVLIALVLVTVIIFLTELTSNVATVTSFMPVIMALALEGDVNPVLLAAPAAIAGSCAFMLPVATAPNAIVYGSGHVTIPQMVRAGFALNLVAIPLITLTAVALAPVVFG